MGLVKEISELPREFGKQIADTFRWLFDPVHRSILAVMILVFGMAIMIVITIYRNLDILEKVIEIKSSCRSMSNGPVLILAFSGVFVLLFAVIAVGQILEVVEYKKRFNAKMPGNKWYTLIFLSVFIIAGLMVIGIMYYYCW